MAEAYKTGQDNIRLWGLDIHNPVFLISGVSIIVFVVGSLLFPQQAAESFGLLRNFVNSTFDWFLVSAGNVFLIFALALICLPVGKVRLGGRDAKPEFSYPAWMAMLFTAGMGIGLMYFGVSEPLDHYESSLAGPQLDEAGLRTDFAPLNGAAGMEEARDLAMATTIFHWGLHPWAIYAVVALALAFFSYNRGLPLTIRSAFYPILGDRVRGWWGHIIDVLAVLATLFGLATSLGLGTTQALAGFNFLYDWGTGSIAIVILIGAITSLAIVSVIRGLHGGVRVLSMANMAVAVLLLFFIIVAGSTTEIVRTMAGGTLAYFREIVPLSMPIGRDDIPFVQGWTAFYWAWWISWSPFVGMFIARISKGRTVREFVTFVILVPTLFSMVWMSSFGGTAIAHLMADASAAIGNAAQEIKMFHMFESLPVPAILSLVGIALVLVFFVTSSDSGSLVIDTITAGGKTDVPVQQRVFWATTEGVVATVLLLVGGKAALQALQAMTISTALPFTVVLLVMCFSIWLGLRSELEQDRIAEADR